MSKYFVWYCKYQYCKYYNTGITDIAAGCFILSVHYTSCCIFCARSVTFSKYEALIYTPSKGSLRIVSSSLNMCKHFFQRFICIPQWRYNVLGPISIPQGGLLRCHENPHVMLNNNQQYQLNK